MTTSKSEPLQEPLGEAARQALQQALAQNATPEPPAAVTETRDVLLRAIGREAEHVADKHAGEASAPLAELARAYTRLAHRPAIVKAVKATVLTGEAAATVRSLIPGNTPGEDTTADAPAASRVIVFDLGGGTYDASVLDFAYDTTNGPATLTRSGVDAQAPEAADAVADEARDHLLRAIGREAEHVAGTRAGDASEALGELARAVTYINQELRFRWDLLEEEMPFAALARRRGMILGMEDTVSGK